MSQAAAMVKSLKLVGTWVVGTWVFIKRSGHISGVLEFTKYTTYNFYFE